MQFSKAREYYETRVHTLGDVCHAYYAQTAFSQVQLNNQAAKSENMNDSNDADILPKKTNPLESIHGDVRKKWF